MEDQRKIEASPKNIWARGPKPSKLLHVAQVGVFNECYIAWASEEHLVDSKSIESSFYSVRSLPTGDPRPTVASVCDDSFTMAEYALQWNGP